MSNHHGSSPIGFIGKLRGQENFSEWRKDIDMILTAEGLRHFIKSDLTTDQKTRHNQSQNVGIKSEAPDMTGEDEVWQRQEARARMFLLLSMEPSVHNRFVKHTTAFAIWKALINVYAPSSFPRMNRIHARWQNLRLESEDEMTSFVTDFLECHAELLALGMRIPIEMSISQFFTGLDDHLENWREMKGQPLKDIDKYPELEALIEQAQGAVELRNAAKENGASASWAKGKKNDRGPKNNNRTPCGVCESLRHRTELCFHEHPENAPQNWKPVKKVESS